VRLVRLARGKTSNRPKAQPQKALQPQEGAEVGKRYVLQALSLGRDLATKAAVRGRSALLGVARGVPHTAAATPIACGWAGRGGAATPAGGGSPAGAEG